MCVLSEFFKWQYKDADVLDLHGLVYFNFLLFFSDSTSSAASVVFISESFDCANCRNAQRVGVECVYLSTPGFPGGIVLPSFPFTFYPNDQLLSFLHLRCLLRR